MALSSEGVLRAERRSTNARTTADIRVVVIGEGDRWRAAATVRVDLPPLLRPRTMPDALSWLHASQPDALLREESSNGDDVAVVSGWFDRSVHANHAFTPKITTTTMPMEIQGSGSESTGTTTRHIRRSATEGPLRVAAASMVLREPKLLADCHGATLVVVFWPFSAAFGGHAFTLTPTPALPPSNTLLGDDAVTNKMGN